MFRLTSASARTPECEAITGAFDSRMASMFAPFEGCERSTIIPRRFISAITSRPSGERPLFHE